MNNNTIIIISVVCACYWLIWSIKMWIASNDIREIKNHLKATNATDNNTDTKSADYSIYIIGIIFIIIFIMLFFNIL